MAEQADAIVLGSGFGGSLLSMILVQSGSSVVNVDRFAHPRFAVGESSTPLADQMLAQLAVQWDLPEILPLANYGTWKKELPNVTCGLKRGFSYFGHRPEMEFSATDQMLVTASSRDSVADTHWLRSDVDTFLYRCARERGVRQFVDARYQLQQRDGKWIVTLTAASREQTVSAPFVIDATGTSGEVLRYLKIPVQSGTLRTKSMAVYAHFANVPRIDTMLNPTATANHPYPCDAAAVHHVLDSGWMWQLRFNDETVSAGLVGQWNKSSTATDIWRQTLSRFSFLERQFSDARCIRPNSGLVRTGYLQRLTTCAAGENWAALPSAAGFIDPLHSTGIAHTVSGICRLSWILSQHRHIDRVAALAEYSRAVIDELQFVDQLVEGCYAAQPSFRLWCAWCMLYFAAVTSMEQDNDGIASTFLRTADCKFRAVVADARVQLQLSIDSGRGTDACDRFESWLRQAIEPWNHVGLLDAACRGMYSRTAARK